MSLPATVMIGTTLCLAACSVSPNRGGEEATVELDLKPEAAPGSGEKVA